MDSGWGGRRVVEGEWAGGGRVGGWRTGGRVESEWRFFKVVGWWVGGKWAAGKGSWRPVGVGGAG